jgi:hypothetical protein
MDVKDFKAIREQAIALFSSQPKSDKGNVSVDAIFIALCGAATQPSVAQDAAKGAQLTALPGRKQPPAAWFTETLSALKGKGEAVTVPRFLLYANRFPVKRMDQVNAARWLREAGYTPRKTGGNLVFDL